MEKRARFQSRWLPYALIAPQMVITLVFFFLPAGQAVYQSLMVQDAFGISTQFVWFDNFKDLFRNDEYLASFRVTA
ncbi:MAG: glycerol-3-phosphate transporter permease, partial [Betaproteobacteria bacterium]